MESWKAPKGDFNWMTNEEGLVRDFPKARILLYQYESAWIGPLKVKQYMTNVAMTLLVGLESKRKVSQCKRSYENYANIAFRTALEGRWSS